jgi:hypothetical protein
MWKIVQNQFIEYAIIGNKVTPTTAAGAVFSVQRTTAVIQAHRWEIRQESRQILYQIRRQRCLCLKQEA